MLKLKCIIPKLALKYLIFARSPPPVSEGVSWQQARDCCSRRRFSGACDNETSECCLLKRFFLLWTPNWKLEGVRTRARPRDRMPRVFCLSLLISVDFFCGKQRRMLRSYSGYRVVEMARDFYIFCGDGSCWQFFLPRCTPRAHLVLLEPPHVCNIVYLNVYLCFAFSSGST